MAKPDPMTLLSELQPKTGWDDQVKVIHLCGFIAAHGLEEEFEVYVRYAAQEERDFAAIVADDNTADTHREN